MKTHRQTKLALWLFIWFLSAQRNQKKIMDEMFNPISNQIYQSQLKTLNFIKKNELKKLVGHKIYQNKISKL